MIVVSYVSSSLTDNELNGVILMTKGAEPPPPPHDEMIHNENKPNKNLFFISLFFHVL